MKLLLQSNADVNAKGYGGETALMAAVKFEHKDIADILLQNSADVNAKDHNDDTALMLATYSGQTYAVI